MLRFSPMMNISLIKCKTAKEAKSAVIHRLSNHPDELVKSITYDNGSKNVLHQEINDRWAYNPSSVNPTRLENKLFLSILIKISDRTLANIPFFFKRLQPSTEFFCSFKGNTSFNSRPTHWKNATIICFRVFF